MKKKLSLFCLALVGLFMTVPVYADITCAGVAIDNKIPNTVHTIVLIIQIVVPILLVVFGMMDLMKGVMAQKEDEIKKGQQTFIKRLIAAAIVFFVIAIVKMVVSFVSDDDQDIISCFNAFINGTDAVEKDEG